MGAAWVALMEEFVLLVSAVSDDIAAILFEHLQLGHPVAPEAGAGISSFQG